MKTSLLFTPASTLGANGPAGDRFPTPIWKRILDIAIIVLTLPVILLGTLFVLAWSLTCVEGPRFLKQERVGKGEKTFWLLKFRTMKSQDNLLRHHAHVQHLVAADLPLHKLDDIMTDGLFPGAKFIRKLGLDELPQIINVIRGEMSLVGPRPCLPDELDFFPESRRNRFHVLPGITGRWQVSGKNTLRFREMLACDESYAHSLSFKQDVSIVMLTAGRFCQQIFEILPLRVRAPRQSS
jgi:lipopolysaccharide/colanic/teichoic acid biosynthesis glycosyltransferase